MPVVLVANYIRQRGTGEECDEAADPLLDEIEGRGLERLEKTRSQSDRDAILDPKRMPASRREAELARCAQRLAIEVCKQDCGSLIVAHEFAAIDVSVPCAALSGNAPL